MTAAQGRPEVGGYQLGARIGAGRIARVHRTSGPGDQPLAIKLLAPDAELDDPAAVARFRHEVAALRLVHHPNVIPLVDHGVDDEVGPYLVMPLLEGRTLRALIAEGPVEPAICALALREIASGLAALHSAGLVHRDLKPENIVVDRDGRPVILDLGLVWTATQTRHTEEGAIAGSVPYMAPEQIDGGDPTAATDLWALAVIGHEWITGQRPFARPRQSEEVAAILAGQFEPLAERDRRVAPELGALIDSCLVRADRHAPPGPRTGGPPADGGALYQRLLPLAPGDAAGALRDPRAASEAESRRAVTALLDEAGRLLARGKPFAAADCVDRAAAHRPGDPEVLAVAEAVGRAPVRPRRSLLVWLAAAAMVMAVAGLVLALTLDGGGDAEPSVAIEAPAGPTPLTADQVPESVAPDRDGLARLVVPRHERLFPEDDGGGMAYTMRHRADEVAASLDPSEHATYARALMSTTRRAEGIAFLDHSLEKFPDDASLWLLRGQVAMHTDDLDRAEQALSRAIALDPERATAYRDRGELRRLRGQLRGGFTDLSRAHQLEPDDAATLSGLVRIYLAVDRADDARPLAKRATELAPRSTTAWIDLAALSPDDLALGYLEIALRNDPLSSPARRAMCLVGERVDDPRAYDDCLRAGIDYRDDPEIVLAKTRLWERRGDLNRARAELTSGIYSMPDDLSLAVKLLDIDQKLGHDYDVRRSRARACELGHQPACTEAPAESPGPAAP